LASPTSAGFEAEPNTRETQSFTITNTGAAPRTVSAALQKLGDPIAGATSSVTLSPSTDPTFINPTGSPRAYVKRTIPRAGGAEHLDASIAYQVSLYSSATPIVYIALLDPSGRQVAYSLPQGLASGFGHVDVVKPTPGNWTALIWTRPSGTGSYAGPVQFTWAAENYVNFGTVYPSSVTLKEGETKTFTATSSCPPNRAIWRRPSNSRKRMAATIFRKFRSFCAPSSRSAPRADRSPVPSPAATGVRA
jgi:hypothetical protein